jgi:cysteine desulfurase / selenocysteine lyase
MDQLRKDFPSLERLRNNKPPVYLDNACTTLVPSPVIQAINDYYMNYPSCGGRRSHHWFAEEVTHHIEGNDENGIKGARRIISEFINARTEKEIIFTLNTTHSINMVALGTKFDPGDVVLLTDREHNSNLLPWLRLQKSGLIKVDHINAYNEGSFPIDAFENLLKKNRVRLVSMVFTSNVTGVTLPAKDIIEIAHRYGARVMLDAAQTVPHQTVDVQVLDVDFLAFSLHKMCGPRGVGVLYAKNELLATGDTKWQAGNAVIEPVILGGGNVDDSTYDSYKLLAAPERFEAGIQNYAGMIASGAAVQYLHKVGMENITNHEHTLNDYLTKNLMDRYGSTGWFQIVGQQEAAQRGGILTFEVRRPNAVGIARELDAKSNVMIWDGVFCAHSYFNEQYGKSWAHPKSHHDHRMFYRVSMYFYNTLEECDIFLDSLDEVFRERSYL